MSKRKSDAPVRNANSRHRQWTMTLNNWTEEDLANVKHLFDQGTVTYFIAGKEVGMEGTPHLQAFCIVKHRMSFNAMKNTFGTRWHIEVSQKTVLANVQYCSKGSQSSAEWSESKCDGPNYGKDADVIEYGTLPKGQGKRTDLDDVAQAVANGEGELKIATKYGVFVFTDILYYEYRDYGINNK